MLKRLFILSFLILSLTTIGSINNKANALSGSEFQAGRIMDDKVFFDSSTMSAATIQYFLNSKVPVCETWHSAGYGQNPPFTCLKDYSQNTPSQPAESGLCNAYSGGTKSSAQIIYDISQACGINPKVLLVLLQKEQSLVTDTWPLDLQYRSATGYGCPDTAACDSQYYWFFNQVYMAARQFKKYGRDSTTYRYRANRDNYIQYNPNSGCGGTNVFIQNQATAGLYNYTPYQPNPSALANLYGTGDGCGAYGNRNFWRMYNDWFGSTLFQFGNKPSYASNYSRTACSIPYYDTTSVGRLYQPDSRDFMYTTSYAEACLAISYGYIWDAVVMRNATGDSNAQPVYRLSNFERHLFTSSADVKDNYIANMGYRYEGIGFYANSTSSSSSTPAYGLQKGDTFFITSSGKEAELYQSEGYYNFGTIFYTQNLNPNTTPIYRITKNNSRLYTSSNSEKSIALANYGYSDEGVVSQNDSAPNPTNSPIYRLRSPWGTYFYTNSRIERDSAVINYGYYGEGIGFYSLLYSGSPVYRAFDPKSALRIYTNSYTEYQNALSTYRYVGEGVSWYSN